MTSLQMRKQLVPDCPVSAEGVQFRIEFALLMPSEPGVEVVGFLVVISVDAHLAGVYSCAGFTGAVVGIGVSWGEDLDVNESSLGARGGLIGGVNVLGDDVGNDALEHLEHTFILFSESPRGGTGFSN